MSFTAAATLHPGAATPPADAGLLPAPRSLRLGAGMGPAVLGLRGLRALPPGLETLARRLLPRAPEGEAAAARLRLQLPAAAALPSRPLPQLGDDESFQLQLAADEVRLTAATWAGAQHGLHALSQLWFEARSRGASTLPALLIDDAPRYPWRGLLVDVARRPLPMDALLRLLDTMAAARLNVLHWHLCDDQAWRLASERYPLLQQRASGGFHYSLDQARSLVQQAAARGIRVLPELDLPGHCWALGLAYPALLCEPRPSTPQRGFGVFPCAVDPEQDALYDFIDGLLGEWAEVFPDPYVHLGGDELEPQPWAQRAAASGTTVAALQARYLARVGEIVQRHGRRLVAWDELGEAPDAALPAGSLLQAWRGEAALRWQPQGVSGRLRSAGYYLDQLHSAAWHWRRRPVPAALPSAPRRGMAWGLEAQLGTWSVEGRLWLDASQEPRLWLRSSGTLAEALAPQALEDRLCRWRLRVDSDLGELELWGPQADAPDGAEHSGWLRLGNRRVPCRWRALGECCAEDWPSADPAAAGSAPPVLGGEAALWSELIEAPQLALRCGPGLMAVAERLWRDPEPSAEAVAALPARLAAGQRWWHASGCVNPDPAGVLLHRLAPDDTPALRALALWLEPGSAYARHHAKKQTQTYHQDQALNRLADALPTESPLMTQLSHSAPAWAAALQGLLHDLPSWRTLVAVPAPLLERLEQLARLGLLLWAEAGPLSTAQARAAQHCLHHSAELLDEMVPALVNALQQRLDQRCGAEACA